MLDSSMFKEEYQVIVVKIETYRDFSVIQFSITFYSSVIPKCNVIWFFKKCFSF